MFKRIVFVTFICLLFNINICMAEAEYDGYIVKFRQSEVSFFGDGVSVADCDDNFEEVVAQWNLYTTDDIQNVQEYIEAGLVEYVEPDYVAQLFGNYVFTPTDHYYYVQNKLSLININGAWNMGVFGNDVVVGVIDSGVEQHEDLVNNIIGGYNYVSTGNEATNYTDTADHGTCCASIIAAEANKFGIIGVAPKAKIVALKCFSSLTKGNVSHIARALHDAVDVYGCDIVNMSFGLTTDSSVLKEAIDYASSKGTILIAAAGNESSSETMYPGGYDNVINVGSVGMTDDEITAAKEAGLSLTSDAKYKTLSSFSNYGTALTFVAPGASIAKCHINNKYLTNSGTSFAAPMVSGIAALCKSVKPDLTHGEFEQLLIETAEDLGDKGKDIYFGYGLVNAYAAVEKLVKQNEVYISPVTIINDNAFQIVNNNTEEDIQYADIWRSEDGLSISELTAKPAARVYTGIEALQTDPLTHYIWDSLENLKPLYKYENN
ncbi:MAG: S8 family serine peptidase [Clostridia bacterium]|nr:S8 family serine peptidase [Clostridia bacterium]